MRIIQNETIKVDKNVPMVKGVNCDGCGKPIEHHAYPKEKGGSAVAFEGSTLMMEINLTGQKAILDLCEECTGQMIKNVLQHNESFKDFSLDYDDYIEDEKAEIIQQIHKQIEVIEDEDVS